MTTLIYTEIPLTNCPQCGVRMNGANAFDNSAQKPLPNDIAVCIACGAALAYTSSMGVRLVPVNEIATLPLEQQKELERARQIIRRLRNKNRPVI